MTDTLCTCTYSVHEHVHIHYVLDIHVVCVVAVEFSGAYVFSLGTFTG